ncbi:MAG: FAD/NAD(P)-binding protein [Verrucomicrobiales bacterium]|nr:FAD/NAD(P)-binding protein [Verrucomicrobiales bacterium]
MYRFAIVGVGPKGTYALERLLAGLANQRSHDEVEIDLFEASGFFGSGQIYSPLNPDYLLLNYSADNVDMWSNRGRNDSGVSWTPTLLEWLNQTLAASYTGDDFVPRQLVGRYLHDGFEDLVFSAPPTVTIRIFPASSTSAVSLKHGKFRLQSPGRAPARRVDYDRVLLSTGHQFRSSSESLFSSDREVSSVFPVQQLDKVTPGTSVAVRGLGLTFIDCVLALTEGRGGTFIKKENGSYHYRPSGKEPSTILPYSRSGDLMTTRAPSSRRFISDAVDAPLLEMADAQSGRQVDFESEVLPLIRSALAKFPGHPQPPSFPKQPRDHHARCVATLRNDLADITFQRIAANRPSVWSKAAPGFRRLYEFGGLTPSSHREFDRKWSGILSRQSFGPPPENAEKLLALTGAGILRFDFSRSPRVESTKEGFALSSDNESTKAHYHINATIPGNRGDTPSLSPLYRSLLESGAGQLFRNGDYSPGCLKIDREGQLIAANGSRSPIHLYGTPTEGIVFDNDTLSRDANNFADSWADACLSYINSHTHVCAA